MMKQNTMAEGHSGISLFVATRKQREVTGRVRATIHQFKATYFFQLLF
jgi:hypothetical protein